MNIAGLVSGLALLAASPSAFAQTPVAPEGSSVSAAALAQVEIKTVQRALNKVNRDIESAYREWFETTMTPSTGRASAGGGREEPVNRRVVVPDNVGTLTPRLEQLVSQRTLLEARLKAAKTR